LRSRLFKARPLQLKPAEGTFMVTIIYEGSGLRKWAIGENCRKDGDICKSTGKRSLYQGFPA
jgi:hypothetical protein